MAEITDIRAGLPVSPVKPDHKVGGRRKRVEDKRKHEDDDDDERSQTRDPVNHIDEYA